MRSSRTSLAKFLGLGLILSQSALAAPPLLQVKTDLGQVKGKVRNGVLEFRGIPYAGSPAGELRWTPPQPAKPWSGILDASEFGKACAQLARFNLTEGSEAEDCLTINVSVPQNTKPGAKLPVIAWTHGGAFVGGSSNLYRLDDLAQQGAVIVSFNYRVGVFGFMPHPSFDKVHNGGYGLQDQREALRWVQKNIAAFGGNPENVTVAGESAGAGSICMHLANPEQSQGLFQKAIIVSGGCMHPMPTVDELKDFGRKVAEGVGCKDEKTALSCLQKAPVTALLEAGNKQAAGAFMAFSPTVGSSANVRSFADAMSSDKIMKVPVLMGGTRDEIRLYVGYDLQAGKKVSAENLKELVQAVYERNEEEKNRKLADKILKEYSTAGVKDIPAFFGSMQSDFHPDVGINNCLYLRTAGLYSAKAPVYAFEFADPDAPVLGVGIPAKPDPGMAFGAVHSAELNYYFPNFSNTSRIDAASLPAASQKLAKQMQAYWIAFAKTGSPNPSNAPAWPLYKGKDTVMQLMPGKVQLYDASKYHRCDFWKSMYSGI